MKYLSKAKNNKKNIPKATIHRLSICHRCLEMFFITKSKEKKKIISSAEISEITGISADQIRKDLAYFGEFGKRGTGYPLHELIVVLKNILGASKKWDIIIAGAGNLGEALIRYKGFQKRGFIIKGIFDNDKTKIDNKINGIKIYDIKRLEAFVKEKNIKIGIIAVPAEPAQEIADNMIAGGIKSILNFAPTTIKYPDYVKVNTIDISIELERLVYFLTSEPK
jgi:redox-sensing transcriptional repressor